jgi:hypothetical protein
LFIGGDADGVSCRLTDGRVALHAALAGQIVWLLVAIVFAKECL